ncbi:hypothetical protein OC25_11035 [Pedobacter kyungheensis]|uniref:DUF5018 domain-containing protein n=1 Tax=Pedobacter kyungheensis TaxID=1069985 RepID=A0A0C1D9S0_9SPHI|nr:hypothetical protein [Pedobacter kyungheensis]KIA94116.1 hypothetical protein OC25_11035 [Pedobacter kyungheensis]
MKANKWIIILLFIFSISTTACLKPRVGLDDTVWGDQAYITGVVLFKYTVVTNQLGYADPVSGYQNTGITTPTNVVDKNNAMVTIVAAKGTDLTKMGIRFTHFAQKIEPVDGAPAAGVIADFSKGKFIYRVTSANGVVRDWTIILSVAP